MPSTHKNKEYANEYFTKEYEVELEQWARRRFRNFCIVYLTMILLAFLQSTLMVIAMTTPLFIMEMVAATLQLAVILWFMLVTRPTLDSKAKLIRSATHLVIILSLIDVIAYMMPANMTQLGGGAIFATLFLNHFIPCIFLPWTAWQSLKAIAPAYLVWAIQSQTFAVIDSLGKGISLEALVAYWLLNIFWVMFVFAAFLPGLFICWYRLRQHGRRFIADRLSRHFISMRRELQQAREIHESLFPPEDEDDCSSFRFLYRPERDIGGDFVWYERDGDLRRMLLLDVTGHGLSAALTVNRIHGEILRIRGEHPEGDPALLMSLLDRYFVLTLAPYNIFATGIALELDVTTGRLRWVSAGHPPAFTIPADRDGAPRELEPTAIMLGAQGADDFVADQQEIVLKPGTCVLAYTDGILEARDPSGDMLGLERLRSLVTRADPDAAWPRQMEDFASNYAQGNFDDDVLVVALDYRAPMKISERTDDDRS